MDDALVRVAHGVADDAELRRVARHLRDLSRGDRLGRLLVRRDVVVHRREHELGTPHGALREAQAFERLRARDLVDEVQVDVDEVRFAPRATDDVALPDLLGKGALHASSMNAAARLRSYPIAPCV